MSLPDINFENIRPVDGSRRAGFEEFCCHLFRRAPEAPESGQFRRIRGAGGDGGVEAIWVSGIGQNIRCFSGQRVSVFYDRSTLFPKRDLTAS